MKIVVLDFSDWKVKIISNVPKNIQVDEAEEFLDEKYNLKTSNIEFMIVPELEIQNLD